MSAGQKRIFRKIVVVFIVLSLLWILFAPGSGVVSLLRKRSEYNQLAKETTKIKEDNIVLQKDIDSLLNDPDRLEEVAREKHNLLKKNEKVYDFGKKKKIKKD